MEAGLVVKFIRKTQNSNIEKALKKRRTMYDVDTVYNLNYQNDCDVNHMLDVYSPKGVTEKLPVIVEVHGGGYFACEKMVNELHGKYFANKGFQVVNINYTLYPEADFKQELQEIYSVFDWIKTNTEKYQFDVNRVYFTGDSAGGHLALLVAAIEHGRSLQEFYSLKPFGIKAIAATCPIFDLDSVRNPQGPFWKLTNRIMVHGTKEEEELYHYASIPQILDKCNFPSVFIVTTKADVTFYPETSRLHKLLESKGIQHEYQEFESTENELDHVFNVTYPEYVESIQANDAIIKYFTNHR